MSQAGIISATSSGPTIPDKFTTDYKADFTPIGISTPTANTLNVVGGNDNDDPISNDNGIGTQSDPDNGPNLLVLLTNRLFGVGVTVNGATLDIIEFPLDSTFKTAYRFEFQVVGKDTTTGDSLGYTIFGSAKTDGATASIVETPYQDVDQDPSLVGASVAVTAVGNNLVVSVTGKVGHIIAYKALGTYILVQ